MKVTRMYALGMLIALVLVFSVVNVLNYFFGWTLAGFAVGAVIGIEVGFFVANFDFTWNIHKTVFSAMNIFGYNWKAFFRWLKPSEETLEVWGVIFTVASFVGSIVLGICVGRFVYGYFEITFLTFDFTDDLNNLINFFVTLGLMYWINEKIWDLFDELKPVPYNFFGVFRLVLVTVFAFVLSPFAACLLIVFIAIMVAFFLSCLLVSMFLAVFIIAGKHELVVVTVCGLIGGLVGLKFGYSMEMLSLSLYMLAGGLSGLLSGWIASVVGNNKYVISVHGYIGEHILDGK